MEIAFFLLQIPSYSWHSRRAPETEMLKDAVIAVVKGVAVWDNRRGSLYTRHVPAEGEDPLAGIHIFVHTMTLANSVNVMRSRRVSRNIFFGGRTHSFCG